MKKLLLLLAFALSTSSTVFAEEVEIEGLWYSLSETTAEVIKYKNDVKYSGDVVIPSIVSYNDTEYSVTSIGQEAFYGCADLTSITIPNSVTNIGQSAFGDRTGLTDIIVDTDNESYSSENGVLFNKDKTTLIQYPHAKSGTEYVIPNSVATIGIGAFFDCTSLTSISIPNSVTSIEGWTFCNCSSLTSITIPDGVTNIGNYTFDGCSSLTSITIPNNVTWIGFYAFAWCSNLTSITIPNSVTSIGDHAFAGCSNLTSITIPNSVSSIKYNTFWRCSSLTSITIPNSVTSIGEDAFNECSNLTSITIPNSVTTIGSGAFRDCSGLITIVVEDGNTNYDSRNNCNAIIESASNTLLFGCENTIIPNSVTTIGMYAFSNRSGLTSITLPNNITNIGSQAFYGCSGLTSITIPNSVTTIEPGTFSQCSGLTSITIPSSVTTIGKSAFHSCSGLYSITIPNSVTTIGDYSFAYCKNITDVYCFAETIETVGSNVFYETPISNIILHVPAASVDTYQAAEPWNGLKKIVALSTLDVPNQKIGLDGTTTVEIGLNNSETNFVAFQMDLTLPEGVSIDKTGCSLSSRITDENQELTVGKLESGDYRITSTSLSLTPISGNEGTLLTLKLKAAENFEGGQATISNIRFSTSNSVKVVMSDETFDIDILKKYKLRYIVDGQEYSTEEVKETTPLTAADEPTKEGYTFGGWSEVPETMPDHDVVITGRFYLFGDVNTDEEVDVVDVVDIARFVVATPSANFREKLADLNKDLTVNIVDAVVLVNHIAGDQDFAMAPSIGSYDYNQCKLQLLSNGTNTLSLCLSGDADFTAFQFDMELPENSEITTIKINGQRMSGHQLLYNKVGDNCYRVAVLSLSNAVFKGREGELLNISIDGLATDEISIHDIHFVTKTAIDFTFEDISHCETVTSINHVQLDEGNSVIFDLQGRKLSKAQRGVNIIRSVGGRMQGKKVFVNK